MKQTHINSFGKFVQTFREAVNSRIEAKRERSGDGGVDPKQHQQAAALYWSDINSHLPAILHSWVCSRLSQIETVSTSGLKPELSSSLTVSSPWTRDTVSELQTSKQHNFHSFTFPWHTGQILRKPCQQMNEATHGYAQLNKQISEICESSMNAIQLQITANINVNYKTHQTTISAINLQLHRGWKWGIFIKLNSVQKCNNQKKIIKTKTILAHQP